MSIAESPQSLPLAAPSSPGLTPYRFTVDQFLQTAELGIFLPEDRVELIEGQVIHMTPMGDPHEVALLLAEETIANLLPAGWHIRGQMSIRLASSLPVPDLVIARGKIRDYRRRKPGPADIGLLIEISDSTLAGDRKVKGPLYAGAGIVEYWIVNLNDEQVEVHRQPQPPKDGIEASYADRQVIDAKGSVKFNLDGREVGSIKVADLLP
jgi:Uma2 family endonuclease